MGACYSMGKREPNIRKTRGEPDTGSEEKRPDTVKAEGEPDQYGKKEVW